MANNIGSDPGNNSPYLASTNYTNKSTPPAPVSSTPVNPKTAAGDSSGVVSKDIDEFLSSPAGNTAIVTANANAGLPRKVKDTDSNNLWGGVGAVEETGILPLLNTKGVVSFEDVSGREEVGLLVKQGLIGAIKEGSSNVSYNAPISTIIENV